jgi:hypothetical protein
MAGDRGMITDDEYSVLMIAQADQFMLALGRWEAPIHALANRGLMQGQMINGGPQYIITEAGRAAIKDRELEEDRQLGSIINTASAVTTARRYAEDAAQLLAKTANLSQEITGDLPADAAKQWSDSILRRALELLDVG